MSEVTFSSSVLVDDGIVPVSRFSEFKLAVASEQVLQQFRDESATVYSLSFAGSGLRAGHANLKAVEARRVLNGQPRATMDGFFDAVCQGQGELVTLTVPLYHAGATDDLETLTLTGIITNVVWSSGPGGFRMQSIDCVFSVCHRLHIRSAGAVVTLTDPTV